LITSREGGPVEEFRFTGSHADELEGGRPIEPGEFTGPIDSSQPKNKSLIDDGLLVSVPGGTFQREYGSKAPEAPKRLTGDALTKRAEELDIENRSKMGADELRTAIAEAEANQESGEEGPIS
jgi:hypothetical protein